LFNKVQDVHDIKRFLPLKGSLWSKKSIDIPSK
jgi:hypothetical protein